MILQFLYMVATYYKKQSKTDTKIKQTHSDHVQEGRKGVCDAAEAGRSV